MIESDDEDAFPRIVELPFRFGDTVYLKVRTEKIPGSVCGFLIFPGGLTVKVTWGDDACDCFHYPFQLSTEYIPIAPGS